MLLDDCGHVLPAGPVQSPDEQSLFAPLVHLHPQPFRPGTPITGLQSPP